MPNNEEKNYTVDDILEEYSSPSEQENTAVTEAAAENVEIVDIYKPTESFEDDVKIENASEPIAEETEQITEEISEDDTDDDSVEISEEIIEADKSEAENADVVFNYEKSVEEMTAEELVLNESALWKSNISSEEMTETEAAELISQNENNEGQTEAAEEATSTVNTEAEVTAEEEKEEETEPSISDNEKETEPEMQNEDVNDKFLIRMLKSLLPWKGDGIGEIIRKIIFLAAVIVFICAGVMLVSTLMQSEEAVEEKKENQSIITTTVATTIDSEGNVITIAPTEEEIAEHNFNVAEHYKSINEYYIGYLEVDGCDIYEPIMQGDDNDYYLDHNYYGGTNKAGTVFLDYRCTVSEEYISPNIVFYGHNQEDGTMFGNLKEYKQNVEFYSENPLVKFSPEFETGEYVIYGYFVTHVRPEQHSSGEVFHYHDYIETLNDEETFNWYINEVQKRNQIVSPVDVQYGDKLLCLSTCSNEFSDSRFVVFARRLREGEKIEDFDFSETYLNYNAEGVDWEAIMSNETSETTEETSETESDTESEMASETEISEGTEKKNKETTTVDTRRSFHDYLNERKSKTSATETSTEAEIENTDESSTETSVPDGEDTVSETAAPSDESDASEETTVSEKSSETEETSVPKSAE